MKALTIVKIYWLVTLFGILLAGMTGCSRSTETGVSIEVAAIADSVYLDHGNRIVAATFDTLRNSLMHAIQTQGFEQAISFCQEQAYPVTATYADTVRLRRTALRVRNPANAPDSLEKAMLRALIGEQKTGQPPTAKLIRTEGKIHYFKAIILQPMCQNCHGSPGTDIQPKTLARIQSLYPNDQAVDFKAGDLRGVWHVVFQDPGTR